MKTFKVTLTEQELQAVINHHRHSDGSYQLSVETTARIHDLNKRLHREEKIEIDSSEDTQAPINEVATPPQAIWPT